MSFNELGLSPHILRAVKELGYEQPTPIQQQAIPAILAGQDVLGGAQTGTGKTAGFTLPMLHRLLANPGRGGRRQVRALVLTPTRELAAQVGESIIKYAHHLPFRTLIAYGGVSIKPNLDAIKLGVDILVATPGRLLDLLTQGALTLSALEVLVLDEADRMLDMGFITDIRRIMKALPEERQTLLFSATVSNDIKALADFREGKVRVLVATDIAARGLDIDQLPHVINFELPQMAEDYIHRIGRTGRAGRGGEAISLVSQDELGQLKEIEALIGQSLTVEILEGYEPSGKPSRQTLPGSKPVQNPPRARGHANAKGKPAAGKGKGDGAKKPAQPAQNKSRKREVVGEDIGFAPMRRLPKAQRGDYQDNSNEE